MQAIVSEQTQPKGLKRTLRRHAVCNVMCCLAELLSYCYTCEHSSCSTAVVTSSGMCKNCLGVSPLAHRLIRSSAVSLVCRRDATKIRAGCCLLCMLFGVHR
eukprot:13893-Heterococcus_DN1.PRE.2